MSEKVETWKLTRDGQEIAQILSFVKGIEQRKILSKALDGTIYIQTIGLGTANAQISLFLTREQIDLLNLAEADGAAVKAVYRDKYYIGYISEAPKYNAVYPGQYYSTDITLLYEESGDAS